MAAGMMTRLLKGRDGQAAALEEGAAAALALAAPPRPAAARKPPADGVEAALAGKVLAGWLSNRRQVLVPHTLNLRALTPDQAGLLVAFMVAAVQADGEVSGREAEQLALALERIGAGQAEAAQMREALATPQNAAGLLQRLAQEGLQTHAYGAALLVIDRRQPVNRAFLAYLVQRLGLSPEVAGSLARRYHS